MKPKIRTTIPVKEKIINHITSNIREYATVILIFFIGIILGIIFINNISNEHATEISSYITSFIEKIQSEAKINSLDLLKSSVLSNIILTVCLWFAGCTVIGMPIVCGIIGFRGFCMGYTISSVIATLGTGKGLIFSISAIFLQNIVIIPAIFVLAVSGIKLYKSIIKDKRKENIKLEILRHTALSAITCIAMILASFIETYVSSSIFINLVEFM